MIASSIEYLGRELASRYPALLSDLEALVRIESPTYEKPAVDAAQDWLTARLEAAGARVQRHPQAAFGDNLQATWPGTAGVPCKQLLAIGHVDTVWSLGELGIEVREGYFYGPGALDMKAGLIVMIHAMEALRACSLPLKRDVVFIVNSDEEIGSRSSRALIEAEARQSHAALILEPPLEDGGVTVGRKGVGRFRVRVQGLAAHAGSHASDGVNAIEELSRQVLDLQALCDAQRGTTVNVGVMRGGTRPNVVPAAAEAEVDLRVLNAAEGERVVPQILGLKPYNPAAGLEVQGGLTRPPWEASSAGEALYQRSRAIAAQLGLTLGKRLSGGGSDGNFTAALGLPTLDGLGPEGAGAHAADERVRVDSIVPRATLLAGLLLDLASNCV